MAGHGDRRSWGHGLRFSALLLLLGWTLALAVPAAARPGFGVKGGSGGSGGSSGSGSTRGSSSSVPAGGGARSGSSVPAGGGARSGGGGSSGGYRADDGARRPGFGRNPSYRDGGSSRESRSRDRFFDRRGNDGGYGIRDRVRYRDRRDRFEFYSPLYYYGTPYYSPFGYGWPYDSVFGYSDWYTNPERRYDDRRDREVEEDPWPARERGNVQLDLQPRDAEIRVDGVLTTRNGSAVLDLPEGTYRLEVTRRGYRPWSTELVIRQGIRYRVEQRLSRDEGADPERGERDAVPRLVGELILEVTPDDAIVTLDGRLLGVINLLRGGIALRSIPVGTHTVTLTRPGYRPLSREFTLEAREPLRLTLSLERE